MRTAFIFPLLATASLAGCAVGPDYDRPDLALTNRYVGGEALGQRTGPNGAALHGTELATWWEGFHDPLLSELIGKAIADNLEIAQAVARVSQARASLGAATAALLPSGNITGQAVRSHQSLETPLGRLLDATPNHDRDSSFYEAGLGASWELDLFGGLRRDREAALADYQATQAGASAARLTVAAQVADTYIVIRGLQARIAVARDQIGTQTRLVDTIRLQYSKGVAAELQLHQGEGALSQVEASLPVLETGLDAALNAMDVLLGAQPGTYRAQLLTPAPIPTAPAIATAEGPADLLRRRPDIIIAERRLAASNARIGSAISEYFPKFSLGGLIGTATTSAGGLFGGGANQAQGVLGLRWRLFDFGRVDAEIKVARGQNAEALAAYRLSVLRATKDVEDAFSAVVKREQQARALSSGEASLAKARNAAFAAYRGGVVSLIEVLDADSRLLAARDSRAEASTEAARAAIASFRALGGGWDPVEPTRTAQRQRAPETRRP